MKINKFKSILIIICCLAVSFAHPVVASESLSIYTPERFKFDASLRTIKLENVDIGPSGGGFSIKLPNEVYPVSKGHMVFNEGTQFFPVLYGKSEQPYEENIQELIKNSISTYGISRLTFDSYNDLHAINNLSIELNPDDKICTEGIRNAYYQRTGNNGNGNIEICNLQGNLNLLPVSKFFDVVSHETGHGILDALNSIFSDNSSIPPYGSFHESFGDLSTFFASVHLTKVLGTEKNIVDFFKNPNLDFCLARNFYGEGGCLRSYENLPISCSPHKHSVGFTQFYLTVMKKSFDLCNRNSEIAVYISNFYQKILINSAIKVKEVNNLYDIGNEIINQIKIYSMNEEDKNNFLEILIHELKEKKTFFESCSNIQTQEKNNPFLFSDY